MATKEQLAIRSREWRKNNPEKAAEQSKKSYEEHKASKIAKIKEWQKNHRKEMKKKVAACKDKPCLDCGRWFPPYVMHFHHKNSNKEFNISQKGLDMSWERVQREMDKCVVLCSNCHAIRHFSTEEI